VRIVMPSPTKRPWNEAKVTASDSAPVSPMTVRSKKLEHVGQAVNRPMKLPNPLIHWIPFVLRAFLNA